MLNVAISIVQMIVVCLELICMSTLKCYNDSFNHFISIERVFVIARN